VAAGSVMARGIDVENCGCVSVAQAGAPAAWPPAWMKGVGWFLVTRNLALLAASLVLALVTPVRPGSPAPAPVPASTPTGNGLLRSPDSLRRAQRGV